VTKGEPATPHSDDELKGKFRELGSPAWGTDATERLLDGLMTIERIDDFATFSDVLDTGDRTC
jgi:hypothetical protein